MYAYVHLLVNLVTYVVVSRSVILLNYQVQALNIHGRFYVRSSGNSELFLQHLCDLGVEKNVISG